jgi:NMD protein affecting ribosome stability and mRNA decay
MSDHTRPFKEGSHAEVFAGLGHDPYHSRGKLREPSVCSTCGVVYAGGRWQWLPRPTDAFETVCTACRRTADRFPAGYVTIDGEFAAEHQAEIIDLLRRDDVKTRSQHPMKRIMAIDVANGTTVVATTDVHYARDLGEVLRSAFQGSLEVKYNRDEDLARVYWRR